MVLATLTGLDAVASARLMGGERNGAAGRRITAVSSARSTGPANGRHGARLCRLHVLFAHTEIYAPKHLST